MEQSVGGLAALRMAVGSAIESPLAQRAITALIVLNAITLGLETSPAVMDRLGPVLTVLDRAILSVFVAELAIKIFAQGLGFFRRPWNLFDFIVVGIALIPSSGPLSVLRALRIMRALRLISVVPAMRRVVQALLAAIPGVSSVLALMLLVFYVYSVIATKLYGAAFPNWFGSIGESMYSLFQIMTLESWSMGIVRPVMEEFPYAWVLFVSFILMTSFAVLNLFIAVIVNAMQEQHAAEAAETRQEIEQAAHRETESLRLEIAALRQDIGDLRGVLVGDGVGRPQR
ncbi:MAG: ion transporter [Alphaproteobacteria bacterium]|nr:ion transporter [Alphaproteobacteria bacterium]